MKSRLFFILLSNFVLSGFKVEAFHYAEQTPESTERNTKLNSIIDDLWSKHTRIGGDRPTINATTFGDGNSTIRGKEMKTIKDRTIYAFQGIRFAEAERFQLPELVDQYWDDELLANHIGPMCPQPGLVSGLPTGSEDCLFLNVYTPKMPGAEKLPVMLFIHGGAFVVGDASYYLPTKLLDHDVILVTIHYRLGSLGFFFMDNDEAPGNYALYDHVASLDWVQQHIEDFGGNKERVIVFGQSAGGVSASYVQLYQQAEGKMHGIISQSGSTLDVWSLDLDPFYATNYVSDYLGCGEYEDIDLDCIKSKSADELVYATGSLVSTDRANGYMGFRGVSPTIQGSNVTNKILYQHPTKYFEKMEFIDVPHMMGTTKQEGSFVLGVMYNEFLVPNDLVGNSTYMYEKMIADIIKAMGVYDVSNSLSVSCDLEYCPDIDMADFNDTSSYCLIDMTGALFLKAGSWQTANLLTYHSAKDIYVYSFDFMSDDTMHAWIVGETPYNPGVSHMDDLMYLFAMPAILEGTQLDVMDRMTFLWTNFATYLDPTPDHLESEMEELSLPKWTTYKFEDTYFMLMRDEFIMQSDFLHRWTITIDEIDAGHELPEPAPTSSTIAIGETTAMVNETVTEDYQDDYDKAAEEADAYMAAMLSFIFAFCISVIIAVYFYSKSRKPTG